MTRLRIAVLLLLLVGCTSKEAPIATPATGPQPNPRQPGQPTDTAQTLNEARKGFTTKLTRREKAGDEVEPPPPSLFRVVQYDSPVGKLAAYLTPDPKNGKKNPAIIWITGGDCNTIGDVWTPPRPNDRSGDQTARQYREAGIVMMFPSLRGGNQNPGVREGYFGEVDDVIAAAEFLAKQEYVDPKRIYLGGHSTGGTLVMLAAQCSDRFRAVFSFGPVEDVSGYPPQYVPPVDPHDSREIELRSPGNWIHSIQSPTFVFEGFAGNLTEVQAMKSISKNPQARFYLVRGADHFNILAPTNRLIAQRILKDNGPTTNLAFTEAELSKLFGR